MRNMVKRLLAVIICSFTLITACQYDDLHTITGGGDEPGFKSIEFVVSVPDMAKVDTRAVDPDGGGVQQMTIFCFDENSLFISTVTVDLAPDAGNPSLSGRFKVKVPDHTAVLQLVGNQNLTYFREDNYRGMSEVDVMAALEASAGRMIYWARETIESLPTHNTADNPVMLLRNQAKITLNIDSSKTNFAQKGWIVVNSNAFGTVAPYSPDHGGFVAPTIEAPFVTLPENRAKLGDFLDVRTNPEEYIFETENSEADPIDFILKGSQDGGEDLYYRISFIDEQGNNVKIMRNHHYTVNVVGRLYYGQSSFEEALTAPATNNVWVSISDNIAEVQDSDYRLSVEKTSVVIGENDFPTPNSYYLHYTLESLGGDPLTAAEVSWMEGNNVAATSFSHNFDTTTGVGTIIIALNPMGEEQLREGTLFVKKGRLSRKIKVVTVKEQTFVPAWITTNIYGGTTGENVTMMFTIPDNCPVELFPMKVLVSVDALDIRNSSGMKLPIIRQGDDLAAIVFTSGTTGKSKGVMLTHKNVASNCSASLRVLTGRHAIAFLPLHHTLSWVSGLYATYIVSEWGYLCDSLKDIQRDIKKFQPYNFTGVPLVVETVYDRIWKTARKMGKEELLKKGLKISNFLMKLGIDKRRKIFKMVHDNLGGNLDMIICGGAYLDPKYEKGLYDLGIDVFNGYGLTECSPVITCNHPRKFKFGSVGTPLDCNEIKIVDPDENGVGEIYVRGSNVMVGYYNDPEATAAAFDGDWFKTGDFGRIDEDGFLFMVGRKKNLIILSNGKNVSPEEVEEKLMNTIPYVKEVLVYQEDDKITGEFFLNEEDYPGCRETLDADVKKTNAMMPMFKRVGKILIRDEEFPKTTTMKIARKYHTN